MIFLYIDSRVNKMDNDFKTTDKCVLACELCNEVPGHIAKFESNVCCFLSIQDFLFLLKHRYGKEAASQDVVPSLPTLLYTQNIPLFTVGDQGSFHHLKNLPNTLLPTSAIFIDTNDLETILHCIILYAEHKAYEFDLTVFSDVDDDNQYDVLFHLHALERKVTLLYQTRSIAPTRGMISDYVFNTRHHITFVVSGLMYQTYTGCYKGFTIPGVDHKWTILAAMFQARFLKKHKRFQSIQICQLIDRYKTDLDAYINSANDALVREQNAQNLLAEIDAENAKIQNHREKKRLRKKKKKKAAGNQPPSDSSPPILKDKNHFHHFFPTESDHDLVIILDDEDDDEEKDGQPISALSPDAPCFIPEIYQQCHCVHCSLQYPL